MGAAKDLSNYNSAVASIREALSNWKEAGVSLYVRLRDTERSGVWKLGGHTSFDEFLAAEFPNALGTHRYQSVMTAIGMYGEDFVRLVGPEGAHALLRPGLIRDESRRDEVIGKVKADVMKARERSGTTPVPDELRRLAKAHTGEPQGSNVANRASRMRREEIETEELREKVRSLNADLRAAEKRAKELEARAVKAEKERDALKARVVQLSKEASPKKRL